MLEDQAGPLILTEVVVAIAMLTVLLILTSQLTAVGEGKAVPSILIQAVLVVGEVEQEVQEPQAQQVREATEAIPQSKVQRKAIA